MANPLRTRLRVIAKISRDQTETQRLLDRDDSAVFDQYTEAVSNIFTLAASAADFSVPMGSIGNVKLIYIDTEKEIQVKLNGAGNDPITVTPRPGAVSSCSGGEVTGKLLLETTGVTSIFLTNPATSEVRVWVGLAGD